MVRPPRRCAYPRWQRPMGEGPTLRGACRVAAPRSPGTPPRGATRRAALGRARRTTTERPRLSPMRVTRAPRVTSSLGTAPRRAPAKRALFPRRCPARRGVRCVPTDRRPRSPLAVFTNSVDARRHPRLLACAVPRVTRMGECVPSSPREGQHPPVSPPGGTRRGEGGRPGDSPRLARPTPHVDARRLSKSATCCRQKLCRA